jgi:hypothetical protein
MAQAMCRSSEPLTNFRHPDPDVLLPAVSFMLEFDLTESRSGCDWIFVERAP